MAQEIKIECVKCKAHYLVEEDYLQEYLTTMLCDRCGAQEYIQLTGSPKHPLPAAPVTAQTTRAPAAAKPAAPAPQPAVVKPAAPTPQSAAPATPPQPSPASIPALKPTPAPAPASPPVRTSQPAAKHSGKEPDISAATQASLVRIRKLHDDIIAQLEKVVVGQAEVVEELVMAILCGGHCLLEGVPGLAKTLLVSSLARALSCSFRRIQFTPDLMPSDITGTEVLQDDPLTGERKFKFIQGPIFAHIILADEINRTPPKTQAALLEAMQERQVSVGGVVHKLDLPFFVLATQNPLEQEGTYPLPEAQQDRFLFKIFVDYPASDEEIRIVRRVTKQAFGDIQPVCDGAELLQMQKVLLDIPVADAVIEYANRLVRATRARREGAVEFAGTWLAWGAGPRATINLIVAARCYSALQGRAAPGVDDVARVAKAVLRHRIALNYVGKAEGLTTDAVVEKLLAAVPKY